MAADMAGVPVPEAGNVDTALSAEACGTEIDCETTGSVAIAGSGSELAAVTTAAPLGFLGALFDLPTLPVGARRLESALACWRGPAFVDELGADEPVPEGPSSAHAGDAKAVPTPNITARTPTRPT